MSDASTRSALRHLVANDTVGLVNLAARSGGRWAQARCDQCDGAGYCSSHIAGAHCVNKEPCPACQGTGWLPIPREEFVQLLAYCGDASARSATVLCRLCRPWVPDNPCPSTRCECCEGPVTLEGFCSPCQIFELYEGQRQCRRCERGCETCHPNTADWLNGLTGWCPTLPAVAAVYAAEFAYPAWETTSDAWFSICSAHMGTDPGCENCASGSVDDRPRNAVRAAVAWRDGGRTREQETAWAKAWTSATGHDYAPQWLPFPPIAWGDIVGDARPSPEHAIAAAERLASGAEAAAREGPLAWLIASIEVGS